MSAAWEPTYGLRQAGCNTKQTLHHILCNSPEPGPSAPRLAAVSILRRGEGTNVLQLHAAAGDGWQTVGVQGAAAAIGLQRSRVARRQASSQGTCRPLNKGYGSV